ncbi:hypothetical protein BC829DRAFT_406680 [Chytridium lagenaria]|nr:hypothetical protein BC829DRAFT_406680 [Chytridium lagenaria]
MTIWSSDTTPTHAAMNEAELIELFQAMPSNTTLLHLHIVPAVPRFPYLDLDRSPMYPLIAPLTRILSLKGCIGADITVKALCEAVRATTTLQSLHLERHRINRADHLKILVDALKENTSLRLIDLRGNGIDSDPVDVSSSPEDENATRRLQNSVLAKALVKEMASIRPTLKVLVDSNTLIDPPIKITSVRPGQPTVVRYVDLHTPELT